MQSHLRIRPSTRAHIHTHARPNASKVSLNEERERDRKEKERLKEFRSEIEDIDAKYPKGDPVDMAERGLVGGYNADGYNIK